MFAQINLRFLSQTGNVFYSNYFTLSVHHFIEGGTQIATSRAHVHHFMAWFEHLCEPLETEGVHVRSRDCCVVSYWLRWIIVCSGDITKISSVNFSHNMIDFFRSDHTLGHKMIYKFVEKVVRWGFFVRSMTSTTNFRGMKHFIINSGELQH
jgi:hypothetical protein